jgi:hypothetical protein
MKAEPSSGARDQDRRRERRYQTVRGVQCWKQGELQKPLWGTLKDVSAGGCYIETKFPFPVRTSLTLLLTLQGLQIRAEGQVVFSREREGMGICFNGLRPEESLKLEAALKYLESPSQGTTHQQIAIKPVSASDLIVKSLNDWFSTHPSLSKSEFEQLLRQNRSAAAAGRRSVVCLDGNSDQG